MVPKPLIILPFLAAFVLLTWQYYRIDPLRRVFNLRGLMMIAAVGAAFGYPIYDFLYPEDSRMSWVFLGLALLWVIASWYLLRRVPPRDSD